MSYLDWFLGRSNSASRPSPQQGLVSAEEALSQEYTSNVQRANKGLYQAQEQLGVLNRQTERIDAEIAEFDRYLEWRVSVFSNALGRLDDETIRMQYRRDVEGAKGMRSQAKSERSALEEEKVFILEEIRKWERMLKDLKQNLDNDLRGLAEKEAARLVAIEAKDSRLAKEAEHRAAEQAALHGSTEETARLTEELARLAEEQVGFAEWRKKYGNT
jgi:hypothetical protein